MYTIIYECIQNMTINRSLYSDVKINSLCCNWTVLSNVVNINSGFYAISISGKIIYLFIK